MTTRNISASNLFDPMTSPTIWPEIEEGSSQALLPSTLEKRKHAETEDESPQSPPALTGKRNHIETEEQPPKGTHGNCACKDGECEGSGCKGGGGGGGGGGRGETSLPEFSESTQNYFRKLEARLGIKINLETVSSYQPENDEEEEEIGDIGLMFGEFDPNREDPSDCCPNPFTLLVFKEDPQLYNELKDFCLKEVAHFNDIYRRRLVFEDIEKVKSCNAACQHHALIIKVKDPSAIISMIFIRGKVRKGFAEAKVEDFVSLGCC